MGTLKTPKQEADDFDTDYGEDDPVEISNHELTEDERLDDPRRGQADELNRGQR